jgi:hypothetical protein
LDVLSPTDLFRDGKAAVLSPLGETDERKARKKLLAEEI